MTHWCCPMNCPSPISPPQRTHTCSISIDTFNRIVTKFAFDYFIISKSGKLSSYRAVHEYIFRLMRHSQELTTHDALPTTTLYTNHRTHRPTTRSTIDPFVPYVFCSKLYRMQCSHDRRDEKESTSRMRSESTNNKNKYWLIIMWFHPGC